MPKSSFYDWFKRFKDGKDECDDAPRSGRLATTGNAFSVKKIEQALKDDCRQSLREITEVTGINRETKETRLRVCEDWLLTWEVFDRVITGDESWIYEYDPETKRQTIEWKIQDEPHSKKARMSKSKVKSMLIAFFERVLSTFFGYFIVRPRISSNLISAFKACRQSPLNRLEVLKRLLSYQHLNEDEVSQNISITVVDFLKSCKMPNDNENTPRTQNKRSNVVPGKSVTSADLPQVEANDNAVPSTSASLPQAGNIRRRKRACTNRKSAEIASE